MTKRLLCSKARISVTARGVVKCDQHHISVECPKPRRKGIFTEECLTTFKLKKKPPAAEGEKR